MNIVAVDVGGTEIKAALMNPNMMKTFRLKTDLSGGKQTTLDTLFKVIDEVFDDTVDAISIVSAGTIDTKKTSIIYNAGTMPGWVDFNLGAVVKARYAIPVFIENDANGALISEMRPHLEAGIKSAVMITLGTGVGTAIFVEGKLYRGAEYKVEFGHMILYPKGRKCTCGQQGCVEQYVSGSALTRAAQAQIDPSITHGQALFKHLNENHREAKAVLDNYIIDLALFLHNINRILDPEIIIIGGGLIDAKDQILPALKERLKQYAMFKPIIPAKDGNMAGIKGAYYYGVERMKQHG